MSDAREGVGEAVRQNRLLLAKLQVRDDALAQEIAALEAERTAAAGAEALQTALGEKIAQLKQERAGIASQRKATLDELAQLDKLEGKLPVMEAQALAREALAFTGADPDAAPPPARMSEEQARAQLAKLKSLAAKIGEEQDSDDPPADDPPPRKRTL